MKPRRMEMIVFGLFVIFGIIMLVSGIIKINSSREFREQAIEINGKITMIDVYRDSDGDENYTVYVDYRYDGQDYQNVEINEYSSSMEEGELIKLLIDPDNPSEAKTLKGDLLVGIFMLLFGVVFGAVGIVSVVSIIKAIKKKKLLLQQGKSIYAIVEKVDLNYDYSVNDRHPYVLYCKYTDDYSNTTYEFTSDSFWTDPYPYLQQGSEVRVYVNNQDYSQYFVDVESSLQGKIADYA